LPRTKVGGLRSTTASEIREDRETVLPDRKQDKFQFCSRASSFILSLRRRRTSRGPDGEVISDPPRSKRENALDWIRFENNYYETDDKEISELIKAKEGYGVGREFWALEDQKREQDLAEEKELRRRLEARPDLRDRVLRPSESEDLAVPQA